MEALKLNQQKLETLKVSYKAENLFVDLLKKNSKIAVVGLGYVGLPIALEFASKFSVLGFDIQKSKIKDLKDGVDPNNEVKPEEFKNKEIRFLNDSSMLQDAKFYIVAVPTPVDKMNEPNLTPLKKATESVARVLKKGDFVVFESTVYPGCTEEECVPILERISGLKLNEDFKVGYSPERINPGDKVNTLTTIKKIVSGSDEEALEIIAQVYGSIIQAGIHKAPTMKVAEAAKIVENTQRDVNIALMNELSNIFSKMNINTHDVLDAAGTKWNFLRFFPGLVGGHCIGVDPYYLIHKSKAKGYEPQVISKSRALNDNMPFEIAKKIALRLLEMGKKWDLTNVRVKGITFKENVSDIRNSKVADLVTQLENFGMKVCVEDPYADAKEVNDEYGITLCEPIKDETYDVVVFAVNHEEYANTKPEELEAIINDNAIVFDIRGNMQAIVREANYMSL